MDFVIIDSAGWLEYFMLGEREHAYRKWIESATPETHITPTVVMYEVFKKIKKEKGDEKAETAIASMKTHTSQVQLTGELALLAADAALEEKLSMADAIIYATSREFNATLVTTDAHFKGKPGVEFIK